MSSVLRNESSFINGVAPSVLSDESLFLRSRNLPQQLNNQRQFDAAKVDRLTAGWTTSSLGPNAEIRHALSTLRARSRNLATNNDYGKRFIKMLTTNVLGEAGIRLVPHVLNAQGKPDVDNNERINDAWLEWCEKGICTVDGHLSQVDVQSLALRSIARDGENLARHIRGSTANNRFGYALQLIEAEHLDESYERQNTRQNRVVMGVEINNWKRPLAYHILTEHPYDFGYSSAGQQKRTRVPAKDIIHSYSLDRINQLRGVPWMHTAMRRLDMLGGYEWAELVASRASAGKMGFYTSPDGDSPGADETDASGEGGFIEDFEPGHIGLLPEGYGFQGWDPQHPNGAFKDFVKAILRGAASGLNVSYNALANDLEGVNYSSLRQGALDDRDAWRCLQHWFISDFLLPIYREWLVMAITTGALPLPMRKIQDFMNPRWKPRGWQWVDPLKEVKANIEAIKFGLKSRSDVHAEQGRDIEDTFEELMLEDALAETKKINITAGEISDASFQALETEQS